MSDAGQLIDELIEIMRRLRNECAWSQEQTFTSLTKHTLEEAYEVADCIESNNLEALPDELADLLMQILYYTAIGDEMSRFSFTTVAAALKNKFITRSPHIFSNAKANTAKEVDALWQSAKKTATNQSALNDIPTCLPALTRANKLQTRAARANFDWPDTKPIFNKINEEIDEIKQAMACEPESIINEIGDLLFTCVNLARKLNIDPEQALRTSNRKFTQRFQYIEEQVAADNCTTHDLPLEELEKLWHKSKEQ